MSQKVKQAFRKIPVVYPLWHGMRLKFNEQKEKNKKKAFDKYAMEVLADVMKVTTEKGYKCVCTDGTLLGPIRDGCLIPWDDDMDFSLLEDDIFGWEQFERDMVASGFHKYRTIESDGRISGQSYKKKDVLCDFLIWVPKDAEIEVMLGGFQIPGNTYINGKAAMYQAWKYILPPITGITTLNMQNIEIKIPENYEEVLVALYGKNWRKPDPNFVPEYEEVEKEYIITYH